MRDIQRIFIHCRAWSQKQTLKNLLNEFKAKGWSNPGYHYVVFPNGKVEQLLSEEKVSNGVQGYNSTSINVAYVGGINQYGKPEDNRTEAQKVALGNLLKELKTRYPNAHIMGHRDIWGKNPAKWKKQCPCFDAEEEYAGLDNVELGKYDDAGPWCDPEPQPIEEVVPEALKKPNKINWKEIFKKYTPWAKN